jgi:hypothetical protein
MRCVSENHHSPLPPNTLCQHLYIFSSGGDIEVKWWGENSKAKWWGYRVVGKLNQVEMVNWEEIIKVKWWGVKWGYQGQVVGISRSTGGGNYQGQVVGISRSSSGDIKAKWWGYQSQGEGLRGQGQKKVVGGACPLQLPLLPLLPSSIWRNIFTTDFT